MTELKPVNVLPIAFVGLSVATLTVGMNDLGLLPATANTLVWWLSLCFGGLMQLGPGIYELANRLQLGSCGLIVYGCYWTIVFGGQLLGVFPELGAATVLLPLKLVMLIFSAVLIYITGGLNAALSIIHMLIVLTFSALIAADFGLVGLLPAAIGHLLIGVLALYYGLSSYLNSLAGRLIAPLGPRLWVFE